MSRINYNMKLFSAIAIIFVVAGHVPINGLSGPADYFNFHIYHVAAFVFVSGYFYSEKSEAHAGAYIWKKFRHLMVPLFLINLVYGIIITILHGYGFTIGCNLTLESLFIMPFTSGEQFAFNLATWFIPPLFTAQVINVLLRKLFPWGKDSSAREIAFFLVFIAIGGVCMVIGGPEETRDSYVFFLRTGTFLGYFALGRIYRALLEEHDTLDSFRYFTILFIVQAVCYLITKGDLGSIPVWAVYRNGPVITYVSTCVGLAFLLRVCRILGPVIGHHKAVVTVADNTYSIMAHHIFAFFLVTCAGVALCAFLGTNSIDMAAFMSDHTYRLPMRPSVLIMNVYLLAGIIVPIFIHKIWSMVYMPIAKRVAETKEHSASK